MAKGTVKKFAIGAAMAAAFGYVAGILTAPKSGRETRADLKDATSKGIAEAEKQLRRLQDDLDKLIDQARDRAEDVSGRTRREFEKVVDTAKDSKEKVRDLLSAVRNGEAEDRDLKKAIADASKAIDHLRDYLSK